MQGEVLKGHLDLLLLATVADEPAHGYLVVERLKERSGGALDLAEGTVYPALYRLERSGLLASDWDAASAGSASAGACGCGSSPRPTTISGPSRAADSRARGDQPAHRRRARRGHRDDASAALIHGASRAASRSPSPSPSGSRPPSRATRSTAS
jgi:hypothetical protein